MRARLLWVALLGVVGCGAPTMHAGGATADGAEETTVPAWVPPLTVAQRLLLAPGRDAVPVPAHRTFPNLAGFRHTRDRQLEDPRDAMQVTKMVAEVVDRSPHVYSLTNAGPEVANLVAQYGPPGDALPDAWASSVREPGGTVRLVHEAVSDDAKEHYDAGIKLLHEGHAPEAYASFDAAAKEAPGVPAPRLERARALEAEGKSTEAEAEYRALIRLDPTLATTHERLAALLFARGDLAGARRSIAHALAYHPPGATARALAEHLSRDAPPRIEPFTIFLDVDVMGAVRVASGRSSAARMYAGCRAVMRYEPELRGLLFDQPANEPYILSSAEEMLCLESAIGAFVADRVAAREEGREPPEDAQAMGLLSMAHTEGLLGYVMFEILGQHRPEHARTAPLAVHRATVAYVRKHILGEDPDKPDELYMALR